MRVRDVMSVNVATIDQGASCRDAVGQMHRAGIRHLPVVDRERRLVGVVTDRDLRHRLLTSGVFRGVGTVPIESLLAGAPVNSIMSAPATTVSPEQDLDKAAQPMVEKKIGSLPVIDEGRVVGIITETDLLRRIVQPDTCWPEMDIIVSYP
jgi:acetoin utilization protein AcuB